MPWKRRPTVEDYRLYPTTTHNCPLLQVVVVVKPVVACRVTNNGRGHDNQPSEYTVGYRMSTAGFIWMVSHDSKHDDTRVTPSDTVSRCISRC